ncbi:MAG: extracellular solute-binding protein [Paenibacillaceae bacterium]|nr:extracellular solute-binding protein [Paenibacillaceae bacterium]
MQVKKQMAVIVSFALVATLFAGCSGGGKDNGEASSASPSSASTNSASPSPGPTAKAQKQIEFSMTSNIKDFSADPFGQKLLSDLNIKINPVVINGDQVEQLKLRAASNNMPEVFALNAGDNTNLLYQWIDQKIVRSIPDEMLNKYPVVKKMMDDSPFYQMIKKVKGGNYYIPRVVSQHYKADWSSGIYYRKDWMKNVGITKEPTTIDEWYQMMKAFTEKDPDQNGKNDTYGLLTLFGLWSGFTVFGIDLDNWVEEDGRYIPGYVSKKMLEPLKFYRKLYQEKILDPEFAQNTNVTKTFPKFTTGVFGTLIRNTDNYWLHRTIATEFGNANAGKGDPLQLVGVLPPLVTSSGKASTPIAIQESANLISSKVDDEKLERILQFYEYLRRPENIRTMNYGFEGKEYLTNGTTIARMTNPATGKPYLPADIAQKYPATQLYGFTDWGMDLYIDFDLLPQAYSDYAKVVRDRANAVVDSPNLVPRFLSTPNKDSLQLDYSTEITKIVMSNDDVDTMFNRFVQESMNKGLAKAIEEVNAKMKEIK